MGKCEVVVGVMGSAKSMRALEKILDCKRKGINILIIKPAADSRDSGIVSSRLIEETIKADMVLGKDMDVPVDAIISKNYRHIIVDEFHMLTEKQVEQLYKITAISPTNVFFYGLKMSFKGKPFPSAALALGYAEKIEIIETEDSEGELLTHHIKMVDGMPCDISKEEDLILAGDIASKDGPTKNEIIYQPVPKKDFYKIYGLLNKI